MSIINKELNWGRDTIKKLLLKSAPFEKVLDIGAGSGTDLTIASRINPQSSLYGIDCVEENLISLKQKNIVPYNLNLEKDKFPFEDEFLDIIISNQVLEHTKELFWIFHEMTRTLKVGGKLIIGVPNLASLHNRLLLSFGIQPTSIQIFSAHIRGFTKNGFSKFLNECFADGYSIIDHKGSNFYPFPGFIAKPLACLAPNLSYSMFLLIEKKKSYKNEFLEYPLKNKLETPYYLG